MPNEPESQLKKQALLPALSLFTSMGTLLCCALPALLVTLGAGASLAAVIGVFPWITIISKYKVLIFAIAGIMLLIAGIMQYRAKFLPCPADPELAASCMRMRRMSLWIYIFSLITYIIGFFFAFLAVYILL